MLATPWAALAYIVGIAVVVIILGFAAVVVWRLITTKGVLDGLIAEPTDAEVVKAVTDALKAANPAASPSEVATAIRSTAAKASLSRFQFLIFTFVVAGLFLLLSIEAGAFVEVPPTVLGLIGLSGGSFVISKGISNSSN
ncbi:hypothetical protein [Caulobacter sp. X]|uniref:hypothetical protein n=1 Tax=Caulobacter sp. X TaxID=2048901 RepID=UPI000C15FB5A|nr:hypothetical protein [Caulobacter sp. X]PIC01266.1 hypothetical protein CSW60_07035 [Caulobacter sp. X]